MTDWFAAGGFEPTFLTPPEARFAVATHRFHGEPEPLRLGERMFEFIGYDVLIGTEDDPVAPSA